MTNQCYSFRVANLLIIHEQGRLYELISTVSIVTFKSL